MSHPVKALDLKGAAVALLTSLIWGVNPIAIKLGLLDAPPIRLAVMRFALGGLAIYLWAWLTGRLAGFRVARHEWRPLLIVGGLLTVQTGLMNVGTKYTTAAHAVVGLNVYAVHTVVLAHFMLPGDRLTVRKLAGVLIAYAGIVMLFGRELTLGGATLLGDTLTFVSSLLLAARTVYLARAVQHLDQVKLLFAQVGIGLAGFVAVSTAFEPEPTTWTLRLAAVVVFQGLVVAGLNFVVYLWMLKHYRASALAAFFLTQPIFGVVAAALVVGEPLTWEVLVATVAVVGGIGLASR